MMTLDFIRTLFPAIPLAIVALNLRYTSLAGLMRNLAEKYATADQISGQAALLAKELQMMQLRISLVKYALFFAGLAFVLNLGVMYLTLYGYGLSAHLAMGATIAMMMVALICFCIETLLSTRALNLHIEQLAPSLPGRITKQSRG
ncbi:MAG: DUF2721 domain-containing protein [Candidatus Puniceispirillaceae bacterium]